MHLVLQHASPKDRQQSKTISASSIKIYFIENEEKNIFT